MASLGHVAIGMAAARFQNGRSPVASHGLLDTLTDGGMGCALLWPFDTTRYFAPWNPIPVAPIGRAFLSSRGLTVVATELVLFAPLLLYSLSPRKRGVAR